MKTTIFYFTGTGNSLSIARKLAAEIPDAQVENIAGYFADAPRKNGWGPDEGPPVTPEREEASGSAAVVRRGTDAVGGEQSRIGFVFPTYAYGLPRMVKEFAETVPLPETAYYFAVASNCGIPGKVLMQLDKVLKKRNRRLDAGFTVLDPSSSLVNDPDKDGIQRLMIAASRGEKPDPSSVRISEIAAAVRGEEKRPLETSNRLTNLLGGMLYPLALGRFKTSDENYHTTEDCSGCGLCSRICPRGNIRAGDDGSPRWGGDCELCHACIQWCPNRAIEYTDLTADRPRYRSPDVAVKDLLLR